MRQATKEVPRWKQKPPAAAGPVIQMNGRQAKRLAREFGGALATVQQQTGVTGKVVRVPASKITVRSGGYRYRKHLVPFIWLGLVIGPALIAHQAHVRVTVAVLAASAAAAGLLLLTRHLSDFARGCGAALAGLTALWLPPMAAFGWSKPWPALLVLSWLFVAVPWLHRYRWRPGQPEEAKAHESDFAIWERLAAKNKWAGRLGACTELPSGGRQYRIILDGAETHIGQVMGEPRKIAAAWGKSITEAYAEPSPDGIESRGLLTVLASNSLERVREWGHAGIDMETGVATIGEFADGQPVHVQYFARRDGVSHFLVAGTTGSGKSELLSLLLCIAAISGIIIPIVLDPQEGQSLPEWKRHIRFAAGVAQCMEMLAALYGLLSVVSGTLAETPWTDEDGELHDGMGFFDFEMARRPIIQVFIEEAPVLLKDPVHGGRAVFIIGELTKRGRKAGISVVLVAQVPSLGELQDQALRDMLAGGNAICLRTANKVSAGMIGLAADPSSLPKYFAARPGRPLAKTYGVGYVVGPDNCLAPARMMLERHPARVARSAQFPEDALLDFAIETVRQKAGQPSAPAAAPPMPPLASVPPSDDDAPEGRTAADAVHAVLKAAGCELECGEVAKRAKTLVTGDGWDREKAFSVRAIRNALDADSRIEKVPGSSPSAYVLTRPTLTVLAGIAASGTTASQG
jgi:hypothetical protein